MPENRRKMTQREYAGMINSLAFRLSPCELKQRIELGKFPFDQGRIDEDFDTGLGMYDDEIYEENEESSLMRELAEECPVYEDMDGDELD